MCIRDRDWCAGAGVLHLLTAHTRDDQAETVLLRLARGSGVSGLAAMAPATPLASVRLLRPLLDTPKARLLAMLAALGQDWVDDPTNQDPLVGSWTDDTVYMASGRRRGMITGTPTKAGTFPITVYIQNGKGYIKKTHTLTVLP